MSERDALADWLRDWRLDECEHYTGYRNDPYCCAPCLRDRILASDWLAERDRRVKAEALREAADGLDISATSARNASYGQPDNAWSRLDGMATAHTADAAVLRYRADRIEADQ